MKNKLNPKINKKSFKAHSYCCKICGEKIKNSLMFIEVPNSHLSCILSALFVNKISIPHFRS